MFKYEYSIMQTSGRAGLLSTSLVLGMNSEIRLYSNLIKYIFLHICGWNHSKSNISHYICEGLGQIISKTLRKFLLREGPPLGTNEIQDLLKVFFIIYGDTFATVGFLPQSSKLLLPVLIFFLYATLLGTKQQATLCFSN